MATVLWSNVAAAPRSIGFTMPRVILEVSCGLRIDAQASQPLRMAGTYKRYVGGVILFFHSFSLPQMNFFQDTLSSTPAEHA